jgi:hypothetical protein
VACLRCHHEATFDVNGYADDVAVPSFGPCMVCTAWGAVDADVRPNWNEVDHQFKPFVYPSAFSGFVPDAKFSTNVAQAQM